MNNRCKYLIKALVANQSFKFHEDFSNLAIRSRPAKKVDVVTDVLYELNGLSQFRF